MCVSLFATTADARRKRGPGEKLYMTKTCMACHGKGGKKAIRDYPNVAGQDKRYMTIQINNILHGLRMGSPDITGTPRALAMKGALVTPLVLKPTISAEEIGLVTDWLSKQEPAALIEPKTPLNPQSVAAGESMFRAKCSVCHGEEGKYPHPGTPVVAGQKRNYILIQLQDIKSRKRELHKWQAMRRVLNRISPAQMEQLADYLSQVDRSAPQAAETQ
ncbi:c-type cytochrome [Pseudomonadota bacterium]